jgi:uncharacterized protein (TIGR02001 family)
MKKSALYLATLLLASTAVQAQDNPHEFKFTAWAASDYRFRGVSQTDEDPVLQAAFDYTHASGLYAGVWVSPVDFGNTIGADLEWDTYVGYAFPLNDHWSADVQLLRYNYTGTNEGVDIEYNELIGKLIYNEQYTAMLAYSNDVFATDDNGLYFNLAGTWKLPNEFSLNASVGYSDLSHDDSYVDYSVGVSRDLGPFNLNLSYIGTNDDGDTLFGDVADDRLVLAAKIEFK